MKIHPSRFYFASSFLLVSTLMLVSWSNAVEASEPAIPEPENVAVTTILATKPSGPSECIGAARTLTSLERPDLAKQFLQQVIQAKPSPEELIALHEEFGTLVFERMASNSALAPEAKLLADAIATAVGKRALDPARIQQLIDQLDAATVQERYEALRGLRMARSEAVGPLLGALDDKARSGFHSRIRAALVALEGDAIEPLIGVLGGAPPRVRIEAIRGLAALESNQAVPYLVAPYASNESPRTLKAAAEAALWQRVGKLPAKAESARWLARQAQEYLQGRRFPKTDANDQAVIWSWDEQAGTVVGKRLPVEDASRAVAARLAQDAYRIAPQDPTVRTLFLTALLEKSAYEVGLDQPLGADDDDGAAGIAASCGVESLENALVHAMKENRSGAAAAAARLLGRIGSAGELLHRGASPTPLVEALRNPDRRVRLAAAEAVLALKPQQPFAGSSRVVESLGFLVASRGMPRALLAGNTPEQIQRLAGTLGAAGYRLDLATNGRDTIRMALDSPDYELALIDAGVGRPTIDLLVQQLRRDPRTARLPVGLIARAEHLVRAEKVADRDPLTAAFVRPHREEDMRWIVESTLALTGRRRVATAERQAQAARALELLAAIGPPQRPLFNLYRIEEMLVRSRYVPPLGRRAAPVLGSLGTATSQRALVELASRWSQPLDVRKVAVKAFRENVRSHGILLTSVEILDQYNQYNQAETADADTQQVLASILDVIEEPTATVGKR